MKTVQLVQLGAPRAPDRKFYIGACTVGTVEDIKRLGEVGRINRAR